jgi:hypothetical protein
MPQGTKLPRLDVIPRRERRPSTCELVKPPAIEPIAGTAGGAPRADAMLPMGAKTPVLVVDLGAGQRSPAECRVPADDGDFPPAAGSLCAQR